MQAKTQLLNYNATHPEVTVQYAASNRVLRVASDANYLSTLKERSQAAKYHFLSNKPSHPTIAPKPEDKPPPINGAINVLP